MQYQQIATLARGDSPVRAAVIGSGTFGAGIVIHARYVPALRICAIADPDIEAARCAYQHAGIDSDEVVICDTARQVTAALEAGRYVITQTADPLFSQQLDVIAEATGIPEAGARHARAAIANGIHVAMVNKETDVTVGPLLKHLADRQGLVYSAVEGDQHGMLIGLVTWARALGMEVLCGGKALDDELLFDGNRPTLTRYSHEMAMDAESAEAFAPRVDGASAKVLPSRARFLGAIGGAKPWDMVELTIAANATGLSPDLPKLHCPACWTSEIPSLLCPRELGGVLGGGGRIDAAQVIRQRHEASMGGGVFIVVRTCGEAMRRQIGPNWITCHHNSETAMIVRPHHLLGIEAIGTMLSAALAKLPTAAIEYQPRYDVVYRAASDLKAGDEVGHDHSPELKAEMIAAVRLAPDAALPAEMARGNRLIRDVREGALITGADVAEPAGSSLWALRREQEALFAKRPTCAPPVTMETRS